ncbi:hypothetical protein PVAP13_9KG027884 [Panicum virgatum]|uniref:Uncharacterized protein n=1 Tax=Panicum virgatum TaxID=38727 RepID=A0A8T0N9W1_PANVG|nr:hypothetical protein PVAP13_9KG027884 [Panicum virgatum]
MAMDSSSLLLASLDRCRRRKSRRRPLRPLPRQQAGGGTPSSGVDLHGPDRRDRLVLNHDPITGQGSILQFLPKSGLAGATNSVCTVPELKQLKEVLTV